MSQIDDLIKALCPDGVPFKALGEVVRIKNGKDHKALGEGDIPVYGSGGIMRCVDTAAAEGPSVLIPRKGSLGNIFYVEGPFWVVDTIFRTEIDASAIEAKFLYHQLLTMGLGEMNQAGGVPSQTQSVLNMLRVPIPPLEVQQEIVRVLDTFGSIEAELEAELEARRRQYDHYRYELTIDSTSEAQSTLDEVFDMRSGKFVAAAKISAKQDDDHPYPCYGGNGLRGYVPDFNQEGELVLVGRQGALSGNTKRVSGRFYATEHAVVVTPRGNTDIDWAFHKLTRMNLNQYVSKGAQPGLAVGTLKALSITVPDVSEQQRVGRILNMFESLVSDGLIGIPAEIRARRKQYEHYRDKLLSFKELSA